MADQQMKYRSILVDPPWPYKHAKDGVGFGHGRTARMADIPMPYPTLTIEEIASLPLRDLSEIDAHLYLWTTQRFLHQSFHVLNRWGFRLAAVLVWSKPPRGVIGTYVSSTEFCLFARRGSLAHKKRHIGTCFSWPRRSHSQKPPEFYDIIEAVSPGPYLELFARAKQPGWDVWGNEVASDIKIACFACGGDLLDCDCGGEGSAEGEGAA